MLKAFQMENCNTTKKHDIQKFFKFLTEIGVYDIFAEEFCKLYGKIENFESVVITNKVGEVNFLLYAFKWEKTPQGADFWIDVDVKWAKFLGLI